MEHKFRKVVTIFIDILVRKIEKVLMNGTVL